MQSSSNSSEISLSALVFGFSKSTRWPVFSEKYCLNDWRAISFGERPTTFSFDYWREWRVASDFFFFFFFFFF